LRSFSLRSRLVLVSALVLVIALGLVGFALNAANYRGAVSSLQARMESYVYLVLAAMEVDAAGRLQVDEEFSDPRLVQPGSGFYIYIEGEPVDGESGRWRSPSSLGLQWPDLAAQNPGQMTFTEPEGGEPGFALHYGVGWQVPDGRIVPFTVAVMVNKEEILQQTSAFRLGLWRSLGVAAGILVLSQVLIFFFGFRPLRKVASDVARVESGQAECLQGDYPRELEPLARNVNRLLETEKTNQDRIRNALDSLAHSLKTPLAVIQAGLPLHGGEAEGSMQNAVDEMSRLIATRLERAGTSARRTLAQPVPVREQLQRILDSLQKVYSHKMIQTTVTMDEELVFYGEKRDLLELMGNLLDNAFKYGNSRVSVSGGPLDSDASRPGLSLQIEDDGPGIGESQWEKLLQRGSRGDEQVEGHGLGLAIVLELVTAYSGQISIGHSNLGGAAIFVSTPST
jgi:two-component system sensor histidine kinase PhoQ